jgi:hypothetical protein
MCPFTYSVLYARASVDIVLRACATAGSLFYIHVPLHVFCSICACFCRYCSTYVCCCRYCSTCMCCCRRSVWHRHAAADSLFYTRVLLQISILYMCSAADIASYTHVLLQIFCSTYVCFCRYSVLHTCAAADVLFDTGMLLQIVCSTHVCCCKLMCWLGV